MIKKMYLTFLFTTAIPIIIGLINLMVYLVSGYSVMGDFDNHRMNMFMTYVLLWWCSCVFIPLTIVND